MRNKKLFTLFISTLLVLSGWLFFSPVTDANTAINQIDSTDTEDPIASVKDKQLIIGTLSKRSGSMARHFMSAQDRAKAGMFARGTAKNNPRASVPDQIIVKYKKLRTTPETRKAIAARHKMSAKRHISFAGLHVYKLQSAKDQRRVLRSLKQNPAVQYAEPDYILNIDAIPDDSSFTQLWGLHNTGQTGGTADADIDAPEAWDITTGSRDVVVAVIDTGVDYNHVDLAANMWTNPGEIPGDSIDNDGNGYVDDVYGINAINNSGDPLDDHSHGTHCSGTIGGVGNNGTGVAGVSWKVKIMALKFLSSGGSGSTSDAVTCIQYAVDKGAHIMSNSWGGGGYSQSLYDAIAAAEQQGILFVAAAGNSASNNDIYPHYPSNYSNPNVLSVAATDKNDSMAYFSCYGVTTVDVAAPGVSIYSTLPGNSYGSYSGTSMATPHVAGLAALIKAVNPSHTYVQIKAQIMDSVEVLPALQDKILTGGRINAYYAINYNEPPSVSITNPAENDFVSGTVAVTATATDNTGVTKVELYIDGTLTSTDTAAPYQFDWDTAAASDTQHTVKVIAYDTDSRTGVKEINVFVNNSGAPGVALMQPSEGSTVLGQIEFSATANYPAGIAKVEFLVDDTPVGEDTTAPYEYTWDSLTLPNGSHTITAKAYGTDASTASDTVTVTLNNIIIPESERNALIALYNSTDGDNWFDNSNWKKPDGSFNDVGTEHTWYGVEVADNQVVSLWLEYNDLTGPLPPEIGNFPKIQNLVLYWNYINGPIPTELGNLTLCEYMDFDYNELTGPIPAELGNLTNLEELWLNDNFLSGGIPAEFGNLTNLQYLYLWDSQLDGAIPAEIGNMTNMKYMLLYYNDLTGPIPTEIGNLSQLVYLDLDGNSLTGSIPAELGNCTNMSLLWLTGNQLTGSIPPELGNLTGLYYLFLDNNQLTGSIPPEIGNLTSLYYLFLDNNQLTGTIPAEIGNLSNLIIFYAYKNQLTGPLPNEIGTLTSLRYLHLYSNGITGEIPASITNLTKLTDTSISNYTNIGYNGLYTNNETVRAFVTQMDPDWENWQTAPPKNVSTAANHSTSVTLNWTPIPFTYYTGKYDIYRATAPGGPYTLIHSTADKTVGTYTIDGLLPETNYYFVITSHTDANTANVNAITSDYSLEAAVTTPSFGSITLTSPNGGESLTGCSAFPITWTSEGTVGNLAIEYSTSGLNGTYIPIVSSAADTGSYSWTVPDTDTTQCFVRIRSLDSYPTDTSDAALTISPCPGLTVTSPNGSESVNRGTTANIAWNYANMTGSITLELYKGNSVVQVLGTPDVSAGTFAWNVPGDFTTGSDYKIRAFQGAVEDYSDANFTIVGPQNVTDFNKDGKPDLLWRYYGTNGGRNLAWFMDNNQRIGYQWLSTVYNLNWKVVGTGDFNNDGNTDILWRNVAAGAGHTLVWFMNGTTKTSHAYLPRVYNLNWKVAGTGDFNGDGKVDILWRYDVSGYGYNLIWYMDGITKTSHQYINRVANTNWRIESVNDFNRDGKPDILWRYYGSGGKNVVWFMNGAVKTSHAFLNSVVNLNWKIEGTGDFNRDGHTDIVWRYHAPGGGQNLIWYMNGTTKTSHTYINRVYNLAWEITNH